jgi:site-specific DNA-methyltransferase (adenine-specific)/site-specific DNA-methyltransferase (cytosine-N4-specific)
MGSGTTILVANRMKRHSIGIDIVSEYYEMVKEQVKPIELYLLEPTVKYETTKSKKRLSVR